MPRAGANEVRELVRRLGSTSRPRIDEARARLTIIGARAVEDLVLAVEGDDTRVRARAMPLLAAIQDARGREPLVAMLLDRSPRLRRIAARCLARFPSRGATVALERAMLRDQSLDVRVAAAHSLVEHYVAGEEVAMRQVLHVLLDVSAPARLRVAALGLVRALRPAQRRGLIRKLAGDGVPEVAERVTALERELAGECDGSRSERLDLVAERLAAEDYAGWNDALRRLTRAGEDAIGPLIAAMGRRAHDPEFCTRAGMVLRALGPRHAAPIADQLERVTDPLPLQILVDVIGALGRKSQIYRLKDLIDQLAAMPGEPGVPFDSVARVRAKAHLELARIGSRVAVSDLQRALSDTRRRVDLEMIAALERIGKRDELPLLLRSWEREDGFCRARIEQAVAAIVRRERIRADDPALATVRGPARRVLGTAVAASPRPRGRKPGAGH